MYYEQSIGPYIPSENLLASLIQGGRMNRAGQKVERGVVITDIFLPLIYQGPRGIDEMWGKGDDSPYVYIRSVRVQKDRVDRCRPIFPQWKLDAEVLVDPAAIEPEEFIRAATLAGDFHGLGDFRRVFGRFTAQVQPL